MSGGFLISQVKTTSISSKLGGVQCPGEVIAPRPLTKVTLSTSRQMITPAQIRMARAALGWGVRELAERARLSPNTISRIENGAGALTESNSTYARDPRKGRGRVHTGG